MLDDLSVFPNNNLLELRCRGNVRGMMLPFKF